MDNHKRRSYNGITYHFIDDSWTLIAITLKTSVLYDRHTGVNISEDVLQTLKLFDLQNKKLQYVRDEGKNVKKACRLLGNVGHPCLGHAIHNNVLRDGILKVMELSTLLKRCRQQYKALIYKTGEVLQDDLLDDGDVTETEELLDNLNDVEEEILLNEQFASADEMENCDDDEGKGLFVLQMITFD